MLRSGNCFYVYDTLDVHHVMCLWRVNFRASSVIRFLRNNLTIFHSGNARPHIAGVICGQHRAACPSLLRGHPPRHDSRGKQQLAHANLAPTT